MTLPELRAAMMAARPTAPTPTTRIESPKVRARLVQDGSGARRQTTRERAEELDRHVIGNLHQRVGRDDGVRRE